MSTPTPTDPGRGFRITGIVLTIVGALTAVVCVGGGVALGVIGIGGSVSKVGDGEVISGAGQITLEADEDLQLYRRQGDATPSCTMQTPDGEPPARGTSQSSSVTVHGDTWRSFDSFRTTTAGDYVLSCTGGDVLVAPPLSIGGIFAGVGGILLAVFGGLGGVALLVVGIILWIIGRSRRRQAGLA
ncbi:hypothetical protein JL108_11245 [Aeromicrobium sp. YIM 150415]|uniref:hypothetical protein n=1 Tax=Aeromicrobium sp. YIM 150415 TaxID=2803912 RepID=UPI0019647654|nr:hypothetical protein [Aeromicrobium sp. YIM 150415]MBM9464024.1 hypothetical protein [Aeromicrobium sp. YIM 150415]